MDRVKPPLDLDPVIAEQRMYEKIGSTIINAIFFLLFLYYTLFVDTEIECWATKDSDYRVTSDTADATAVHSNFQALFVLYSVTICLEGCREFLNFLYYKYKILWIREAMPYM